MSEIYLHIRKQQYCAISRGRLQRNLMIEEHKTTKSPGRVAVPEIVRCINVVYLHRLFQMYMNGIPIELSFISNG